MRDRLKALSRLVEALEAIDRGGAPASLRTGVGVVDALYERELEAHRSVPAGASDAAYRAALLVHVRQFVRIVSQHTAPVRRLTYVDGRHLEHADEHYYL